jgi:predicted GIY-YIG superfamily endonuclease
MCDRSSARREEARIKRLPRAAKLGLLDGASASADTPCASSAVGAA